MTPITRVTLRWMATSIVSWVAVAIFYYTMHIVGVEDDFDGEWFFTLCVLDFCFYFAGKFRGYIQ